MTIEIQDGDHAFDTSIGYSLKENCDGYNQRFCEQFMIYNVSGFYRVSKRAKQIQSFYITVTLDVKGKYFVNQHGLLYSRVGYPEGYFKVNDGSMELCRDRVVKLGSTARTMKTNLEKFISELTEEIIERTNGPFLRTGYVELNEYNGPKMVPLRWKDVRGPMSPFAMKQMEQEIGMAYTESINFNTLVQNLQMFKKDREPAPTSGKVTEQERIRGENLAIQNETLEEKLQRNKLPGGSLEAGWGTKQVMW